MTTRSLRAVFVTSTIVGAILGSIFGWLPVLGGLLALAALWFVGYAIDMLGQDPPQQ